MRSHESNANNIFFNQESNTNESEYLILNAQEPLHLEIGYESNSGFHAPFISDDYNCSCQDIALYNLINYYLADYNGIFTLESIERSSSQFIYLDVSYLNGILAAWIPFPETPVFGLVNAIQFTVGGISLPIKILKWYLETRNSFIIQVGTEWIESPCKGKSQDGSSSAFNFLYFNVGLLYNPFSPLLPFPNPNLEPTLGEFKIILYTGPCASSVKYYQIKKRYHAVCREGGKPEEITNDTDWKNDAPGGGLEYPSENVNVKGKEGKMLFDFPRISPRVKPKCTKEISVFMAKTFVEHAGAIVGCYEWGHTICVHWEDDAVISGAKWDHELPQAFSGQSKETKMNDTNYVEKDKLSEQDKKNFKDIFGKELK